MTMFLSCHVLIKFRCSHLENLWFCDDFQGGIEVNQFAQDHLILVAKFGTNP